MKESKKYYRLVDKRGNLVYANINRRLNNGLDPDNSFAEVQSLAMECRTKKLYLGKEPIMLGFYLVKAFDSPCYI